jgi:hypothetical protein
MARNRIIYASQSVWCNGEVLYRVSSLGSTTTFTNEDIFELGHLDIVDVVDDVPAVAVTLNTMDWGDLYTMATLAQVPPAKRAMSATVTPTTANLEVVDATGAHFDNSTTGSGYYHGVGIPDFAITCGNLTGVSLWAPVQDECSLGTLADNIDQTMWMDEVYINSLEFSYTTGANATENYGAETDQKAWFLNSARFINFESFEYGDLTGGGTVATLVGVATDGVTVATLSDGDPGFLRKSANGQPAISIYDASENTITNYAIVVGAATATKAGYNVSGAITLPTGFTAAAGDRVEVIYAGDGYASTSAQKYFSVLDSVDRPDTVGALRQGHVEVYIVDPDDGGVTSWEEAIAFRLTNCTITADLTRELLTELGHLGPYDRPLTLPIPLTVTMDTTAGDLEHWARWAGILDEYNAGTRTEIDLADLFANENMKLVVKLYAQTDEEAGGTGADRKILGPANPLIGQSYWLYGEEFTYAENDQEYPMKTMIIEHLKITDEAYTLDLGANATQTFGFRSTNDLYAVKGEVKFADVKDYRIRRNQI